MEQHQKSEIALEPDATTKPSYQKCDIFLFRVPFQRPKDKQRYLLGVDSIGTADMSDGLSTQCRVYLPAGSVVRKEMLLDNTAWWEGVVNGTKKDGSVVIQGNSVEAYVGDDDEDIDAVYDGFDVSGATSQEDDDWQAHVAIIKKTDCAWCSSPLKPEDANLIVNADTIFCPSCKRLEEVTQFLPQGITYEDK